MLRESVVKIARLVTGMFIPGGKKVIENSIKVIKNARLGRDGGDDSHSGTGPCPKCGSGAMNFRARGVLV